MVRKSETVIWSLILIAAPSAFTTAIQQYMAGNAMQSIILTVVGLLAAVLFVVSFMAEFAFEDDVKELVDARLSEETADDDLEELASKVAEKLAEEGVTAEDITSSKD